MGWFWSEPAQPALISAHPASEAGKVSKDTPASDGTCPHDSTTTSQPVTPSPQSSLISRLNPLNYMPSDLSQSRVPGQTIHLPTEREVSTIPKGSNDGNWEYPSPQQMYSALLRKGYNDDPAAIESMVAVHNFLNEGAWAQIVSWERRFGKGLKIGWQLSSMGEENAAEYLDTTQDDVQPKLVRFKGNKEKMTPKARILSFLGWMYPEKYG